MKKALAKLLTMKGRFLSMLLGTLEASLYQNLLTGKGTIRAKEDTISVG